MRLNDLLGTWARGRAERARLRALYGEVTALARGHEGLELDLTERVVHRALPPEAPPELCDAAEELVSGLLAFEGLFQVPEVDPDRPLATAEVWQLTATLGEAKRAFEDRGRIAALLERAVALFLEETLERLPAVPPTGDGAEALTFRTPLCSLLDEPARPIEAALGIAFAEELEQAGLFRRLAARLERNLLEASGIDPERREKSSKRPVPPTKARDKAPAELVGAYLGGTPFADFFGTELPFTIPLSARFEHAHVVGGTGHGKTQLLQLLIHHDVERALAGQGSLVVLDSQGDLIRTISHLAHFSPEAPGSLAERLVLIDPNDVEHPAALNLFDLKLDRLERYGPVERERLLNGAVALYEYMFGALLGAELTQRQGVIFKYLARLLMVIPGATIHTLRELMEDPEACRPYVERLEGTTRHFVATQFTSPAFADTRQQILTRLWGVLSNPVLERLFSHERNAIDLFEAMNAGKVVLINTAKDLLKSDGCRILGRFFVALLAQATQERATLPPERRRPCFVYVDEAQEYADEQVGELLNQARKYRVGLTLAHQNLEQLDTRLRATMMASTSIKLAGGVSAKDAEAFAREMGCAADVIRGARKRRDQTEFACWIKNVTGRPLTLAVPLGAVERLSRLSASEYEALIAANRARYCASPENQASGRTPWREAAGPAGKGGFQVGEYEVL